MRNPITYFVGLFTQVSGPRSPKWRHVRQEFLKDHDFCKYCGSRDDLEVHHIVPVHIEPDLELVESNLITLCMTWGKECHLKHGHLGNWKLYNKNIVKESVMEYTE